MSIKHAILTLMVTGECSGYDIVKAFDSTIGHFWKASHQQIYKTLGDMHRKDWVDYREVPQQGKPDKKLYAMTDRGLDELREWGRAPCKAIQTKEELLIRLAAIEVIGRESVLNELVRQQDISSRQLAEYKSIEAEHYAIVPIEKLPLNHLGYYLTLRRGITSTQAKLEWIEEAMSLLNR